MGCWGWGLVDIVSGDVDCAQGWKAEDGGLFLALWWAISDDTRASAIEPVRVEVDEVLRYPIVQAINTFVSSNQGRSIGTPIGIKWLVPVYEGKDLKEVFWQFLHNSLFWLNDNKIVIAVFVIYLLDWTMLSEGG